MSDRPDPAAPMAITDPRWRQALAQLRHPIFVIRVDGVIDIRDTDELGLGEDHGAWLAFIDQAVGGSAETVVKHHHAGRAYYLDSAVYHRGSVSDFNPMATMLSADDLGVELRHAQPLFGTVVMTAFDTRTNHPRPFDGTRVLDAFDAVLANDRFAQTVVEHLGAGEAQPQ